MTKAVKAKGAESAEEIAKTQSMMGQMLTSMPTIPQLGDMVEGTVVESDRKGVFIDLPPYGTGIIYGREYMSAREVIKKIALGDSISAKVVGFHDDGYIELSLREARQAQIWAEAELAIKTKATFDLPIKEANKGGLLVEWQGITGFLPASQLKSEHYPRVQDGDKDKILEELKKLVGTRISMMVIGASPKEGKLIFSEKSPEGKEKEKIMASYKVGDEVDAEITGIVEFGVFAKLEDGLEGLIHISEIDWGLVEDPKTIFKLRQKVHVKIIEIKEGKISLSIKALKANPWKEAALKYKKDQMVDAVVIKFNKHGALASIEEGVAGLVHVSEFGTEAKLREKLELGKTYQFKISLFDPKEQKMALSYVDKGGTAKK